MKNQIRKVLCLALTAAMALGLLTIAPRAARASKTLYTAELSDTGLVLTEDTTIIVDNDFEIPFIIGNYDLTVKSLYENTLTVRSLVGSAIYVKNLTVDGYLEAHGSGTAVHADGTCTVKSGDSWFKGKDSSEDKQDGCGLYADKLIVNDGELSLEGENIALSVNTSVTMTDGSLSAEGFWSGLNCSGHVSLTGGRAGFHAIKAEGLFISGGNLTLGGAIVTADTKDGKNAILVQNGDIDVTGGEVYTDSTESAIRANKLTTSGGNIEIDPPMNISYPLDAKVAKEADHSEIIDGDGDAAPHVEIMPSQGTVTMTGARATLDPSNWSTAVTSLSASPGTTVYIMPNSAPTGQRFRGWDVNVGTLEISKTTDGFYSFVMPENENPDIKAVFSAPDTATEFTDNILRSAGSTRYQTAIATAEIMKRELGVSTFDNIILASGKNFPDALSGAYLATKVHAPILLVGTKDSDTAPTMEYIRNNLTKNGRVYILGGGSAVAKEIDNALFAMGASVMRLSGENRIETNLKILMAADGKLYVPLLIADSSNFADALSASATGFPLMLVNKKTGKLTDAQREYIHNSNYDEICILGGENAVPASIEAELADPYLMGSKPVTRIAGENRYETSALIAQEFFDTRNLSAVATGKNFPDGLSGGPLAYFLDAPLILTAENNMTASFEAGKAITKLKSEYLLVFGGTAVLSDDLIKAIIYTGPKG